MKKKGKNTLLILTALVICSGLIAYVVFKNNFGKAEVVGSQSEIPETVTEIPPLNSGSSDWLNWRGPNYDGKSQMAGIKTDWSKGLKKLWEVDYLCQGKTTASWSASVVKGNRLVIPGRNETSDLVFCINTNDGSLIWKGEYEAEASDGYGPGARATPFIDGDRVYTYGRSGDLVCWQLLDGKILWKKNVKEEGGEEPNWGLSSTPLILDSAIIVQGGGKAQVVAYHKLSGKLLWKSLEGAAGYAASIPFKTDSTEMLLVYHGTALACLDPTTGKELWQAKWETKHGVNATTPAISGDTIFHTSGYGKGCQAIKANSNGFDVLWTNQVFASHHSDPIIIDGYIYGYSGQSNRNRGDFKCVELKTGEEVWSTDEMGYGTAIYVDGHIICFDLDGNLFLVKPEPKGFNKMAEIEGTIDCIKNPAWTSPVVANGKLYLRYLQRLVCYEIGRS